MTLDNSIKKDLHRHKIDVEQIVFATLLSDADATKLTEWIKTLSSKDYIEFFKLCDNHKEESEVLNNKIFRTSKGNLYSYNELKSTANVYYPFEDGMKFGECEHISETLSGIEQFTYLANLFEKIKTNIESFRQSDSTKDDAANLLAWIVSKDNSYTLRVKSEILLLQNWHDDYNSFESLLLERPKNTILFDNYTVKGYIPEVIKTNNWLLNPAKAKKACWLWVVSHWQDLQEDEDWGENTHRYIADVKKVYNTVGVDPQGNIDQTKLRRTRQTLWSRPCRC